ncbi:hypothetical protein IC620_10965 [Hazenella sp. IB182357]|uniref:Uncharacterized protein n=1 Tax=Polycladospora coralii TaxID=2771432 RepID=A0A926NAE4_9BACL|nr:hypothetical protein [Polycladospora coralii]MBD1372877.1 hypothetical protein [Polycladospora coralii]
MNDHTANKRIVIVIGMRLLISKVKGFANLHTGNKNWYLPRDRLIH